MERDSATLQTTADPVGSASPLWTFALCWKEEPRAVNALEEPDSLVRRFEQACRECGAVCLVDTLSLPPARGVRSLLKPIPRVQSLVTSVWRRAGVAGKPGMSSLNINGAIAPLRDALLQRDHVAFWVPGRAIPTLAQVEKRLAHVQVMGAGALLGSLHQQPALPPVVPDHFEHPEIATMRQHEERVRQDSRYGDLQYDRRCFQALSNSPNGDLQPGLRFDYHEEDGVLWAWYEGNGVFLGSLVAIKSTHGVLRMAYQHANASDEIRTGQCISYPEFLPDGRLLMHEFWRWTIGDRLAGTSQIEECEGTTIPRKYS